MYDSFWLYFVLKNTLKAGDLVTMGKIYLVCVVLSYKNLGGKDTLKDQMSIPQLYYYYFFQSVIPLLQGTFVDLHSQALVFPPSPDPHL